MTTFITNDITDGPAENILALYGAENLLAEKVRRALVAGSARQLTQLGSCQAEGAVTHFGSCNQAWSPRRNGPSKGYCLINGARIEVACAAALHHHRDSWSKTARPTTVTIEQPTEYHTAM